MAVIINELEVVVEQPGGAQGPQGAAPAGAQGAGQAAQRLSPLDIQEILRRQAERALRLSAE